jgi:hypothetical protein
MSEADQDWLAHYWRHKIYADSARWTSFGFDLNRLAVEFLEMIETSGGACSVVALQGYDRSALGQFNMIQTGYLGSTEDDLNKLTVCQLETI